MAGKMFSHSGVVVMFDIKQMSSEPVSDPVPRSTYILDIAKIAF